MKKAGAINLKQPWVIVLLVVVFAVIIYFYNNTSQDLTGNAAVVIVEGTTTVFVEHFDVEEGDIVPENLGGVGGGHRVTATAPKGISDRATYLGDKNYLKYDMASMHLSNKKISDVSKVSFYFKPQFRITTVAASREKPKYAFLALGDVGNRYNNLELYSEDNILTVEINDKTGKRMTCPVNVHKAIVEDDWYFLELEIYDDSVSLSVEDYLTKDIIALNGCDLSETSERFSTFEFDSFNKIWVGVDSRTSNGADSLMDELRIYF